MAEKLALLPNTFEAKQYQVQTTLLGSLSVVPPNPMRVYLAFQNTSGVDVYLGINVDVISTFGRWTLADRSSIEFYLEKHKILQTLEWFAEDSVGGSLLTVIEVLYKGG